MIELNKIYNADCIEAIRAIPRNSVDAVICDPPYTISRESGFDCKPTGRDVDRFHISIDFGEWDSPDAFDIASMCKSVHRVLKDGGYFVCFYDLWKITQLREQMEQCGFGQIRFIEWVKTNPVPINSKLNYLTNAREVAVCCVKGSKPIFNSEYDNGIYSFPICHDEDRIHPTQKPVELIRALIQKHTRPGDTVLDCCMGSGTTAIACIREHRNFIGFELNKEYYDKSLARINAELSQPDLF